MPTGGCSYGVGFAIGWQNGPLGTGGDRKEPNGAFVEEIVRAAKDRLEYYQSSPFKCHENATAIEALDSAIEALNHRTSKREALGIEGTHAK